MSDFTPGPWHDYEEDGCITGPLTEDGKDDPEGVCLILGGPHAEANADLIMAALDLLAALEDVRIAIQCQCDEAYTRRGKHEPNAFCYLISDIDAVIAKARGES